MIYHSCIPALSRILHNMWADEDHSLSFTRSRSDWESSFSKSSTRSFKPTSLFALADLDVWDNACLFKAQSSAQCGTAAASGLGLLSNPCSTVGFGQTLPSMRQWMSMSDPVPENVPGFSPDPSRGAELHSAQEERSSRRAELVHRLQEAQQRLEDQNDLIKSRGPQRHSSKTTAQLLDMKHKKANLQQQAQGVHLRQQGKAQYNGAGFAQHREHENQCQDATLIREAMKSFKEVNETLRSELKMVKQSLEMSQAQLCELRAEKDVHARQMSTLQAQCTQLIQEKEEVLADRSTHGREELAEWKEECKKLRETLDALHAEHQRLQDRCLCLESEVLGKEEELCMKAQEFREQESERLSGKEELRAVAAFWNEKWQEAALSLSSTQRELEAMKQQDPGQKLQEEATKLSAEVQGLQTEQDKDKEEKKVLLLHTANLEAELKRTKRETNSLLRVELDACKQQLELEKNRSKALVHTQRGKRPVGEAVQTLDKETMTVLSMPPKTATPVATLCQPTVHSNGSPNYSSQTMSGCLDRRMPAQENVLDLHWTTAKELDGSQWGEPYPTAEEVHLEIIGAPNTAQQLANMQVELKEKEHALEVQEILRDAEQSEAERTISALKLKLVKLNKLVTDDCQDGGQTESVATDLLGTKLEENQRFNKPKQEKERTAQGLQTLTQSHLDTDDRTSSERQNTKMISPVDHDRQRRMVTEQLKNLFKERKDLGKACDSLPAAQSPAYPQQELAPKSQAIKSHRQQELLKCRNELYGSGLAPVSEEDEDEEEEEEEEEEEMKDTQEEQG